MTKVLRFLPILILSLAGLCLAGYVVALAARGSDLGGLGTPIRQFVLFPEVVGEVLGGQEIRNVPLALIPSDDGYDPERDDVNRLDRDLYALFSLYDEEADVWKAVLENYRTGERPREWTLGRDLFVQNTGRQYSSSRPKHSLLLPDGGLIVNFTRSRNLLRVDARGDAVWANREMLFHHGMNLDHRGRLWVCATPYLEARENPLLNYTFQNADGARRAVRDDHLVAVDTATGRIVEQHSIIGLLAENDLFGMVAGQRNNDDPIHLNDIQPVLTDGPHWRQGDLFFSARDLGAVVQYRPSSGRVVRVLRGPITFQHDVDIVSDHEVSVFDNRYSRSGRPASQADSADYHLRSSEIVVFDLAADSAYVPFREVMNRAALHTPTGGQHRLLGDGSLWLDLDDFGRIVVLDSTGLLFSRTYPARREGYKQLTNWPRIYESLPFAL